MIPISEIEKFKKMYEGKLAAVEILFDSVPPSPYKKYVEGLKHATETMVNDLKEMLSK